MRVLVAHDVPSGNVGGMNRIMRFTHDPLVQDGHEVDYFTSENVLQTNPLVRRFAFPRAVFAAALEAYRRNRRYDIINVHEAQSAWVSLFKHRAGNPYVVVTSHGSEHRSWDLAKQEGRLGREAPALKTRLLNPLTRLWPIKLGLTHADYIFCLNEQDRRYFNSRFGMDPKRLIRFWPGAKPEYFSADPRRVGRPVQRILFNGTWRKNKGTEDLVPAFAQLSARHPDIRLTVLGSGVARDVVLNSFPNDVRRKIDFAETSGDEENVQHLLSSDLFLLPSLFEGTPLALMEAMASGLPVVATRTCGMMDLIRDGENGLLVPTHAPAAIVSAVERLLENSDLRVRLALQAQADVRANYTWEASASRVRSFYEMLAPETPTRF